VTSPRGGPDPPRAEPGPNAIAPIARATRALRPPGCRQAFGRIALDRRYPGRVNSYAIIPPSIGKALQTEDPAVKECTRFFDFTGNGNFLLRINNKTFEEKHVFAADSNFFKVFTGDMIAGNITDALLQHNSVVLNETTAKKYFNSIDVIGKTLFIDNSTNCKITGVIKDMPKQSHFHFSFIRPRGKANDSWLSNNAANYVLVRPGVSQQKLQSDVDATINNYLSKELEQQLHSSIKDLESKGNHFIYHTMPLTDIHLHSDKQYEIEANGNITYVYIFSVIAVFILLIACVNFMNLSTARSANRAKEVGIRKVAGSLRKHLITQFLTESVLISFFALVLAILTAMLLLPLFNELAGKEMSVLTLFSTWLFPVMIALVLVVGIVAGSYPAFYLSSFQPIDVLKGKTAKGFKNSWLRSSLVVFQFSISIILIIGTIIIYNQLDYIQSKKIGYNRDQVLVLHNAWYLDKQIKPFRNELLNIPGVTNATISGDLPTGTNFDNEGWFRDASMDAAKAVVLTNFFVDEKIIQYLNRLSDYLFTLARYAAEKLGVEEVPWKARV